MFIHICLLIFVNINGFLVSVFIPKIIYQTLTLIDTWLNHNENIFLFFFKFKKTGTDSMHLRFEAPSISISLYQWLPLEWLPLVQCSNTVWFTKNKNNWLNVRPIKVAYIQVKFFHYCKRSQNLLILISNVCSFSSKYKKKRFVWISTLIMMVLIILT